MNLFALSKVELHLHLDCSLSYAIVRRIDPAISLRDYRHRFIAPAKCTDLADFLTRAPEGVRLMQTEGRLRLVTADLFRQLREDGVIYAEIRFAPLLHTGSGLSPDDVVAVVVATFRDHPVGHLYEAGLSLSINTDARTITDVTLTQEYERLRDAFGWGADHFLHCNLEALRASFIPEVVRHRLMDRVREAHAALRR